MLTINYQLQTFASSLYINPNSQEGEGIQTSVNYLTTNLKNYFRQDVRDVRRFGSYTRGTILPRKYDVESDVDIMVVFNYDYNWQATPRSLRERLLTFARSRYTNSTFYRSRPVVVLELDHIQYDLVPTIITGSGLTYIPLNDADWQTTNPHGFNQSLTNANTQYNNIVKPIARLMKAWNAMVGFPLQPYLLEQEIADMNFSGDNYEKGFFWAAEHLAENRHGYSLLTQNKIKSLKSNIARVKEALASDNSSAVQIWLSHILPI